MPSGADILQARLERQLLAASADGPRDPAGVVRRLCAMQAQDYAGALWSVGVRCAPGTTVADVERTIAEGRIVRTWPMRGTLHLVAPEDVHWLLALLAPRRLAQAAGRHRQLGLDDAVFGRAGELFADALRGGRVLTRGEMMALLEGAGIATDGQRGYHVLWTLAQRGLLCCGPMRGAEQTFVLLDEWAPPPATDLATDRPAALALLAERYVAAHGPATVADFARWAGLTATDARLGVEGAGEALGSVTADGIEYRVLADAADALHHTPERAATNGPRPEVLLVPGFDEYQLGYADRSLMLGAFAKTYGSTISANGMFSATVVVDGRVAGVWKRSVTAKRATVTARTFRRLTNAEKRGLRLAAERYAAFLGVTCELRVESA